ncbi:uncharacterized protein LTR77_009363 [Saxophila tyrrhenica]|uniref:Transmembrane protein 42 n=1 Tax=Saxophila tyrrhenica TaxID=1690608 RepID=A0AAV9NZG6_9PEZI|nr:hypothetical protein LTR77_009363 [Saxophila tyrrhenica]
MSSSKSQWLLYAILSGGCAALNGVFAKLTTTHLTTSWASSVSRLLGQDESSYVVESVVRIGFFLLNLTFNGIMWTLFTRALTLANSTVRVSVLNTSANFVLTALLGAAVFGETLPGLWWVGAALLVAGSVIIGRRDEGAAEGEKQRETGKEELKAREDASSTGVGGADSASSRRRKPKT